MGRIAVTHDEGNPHLLCTSSFREHPSHCTMRVSTSLAGILLIAFNGFAFPVPDANFRAWINANCPGAMTGNDLDTEHPSVLSLTFMDVSNSGIQNLSGAWAFSNVTNFNASNNPLTLAGLEIPPGTISAISPIVCWPATWCLTTSSART
ncbi:MAG: hypothetical protein R2817_01050 [Flavobacteriales bacterium]